MAVTRTWKVYGTPGSEQKMTYKKSKRMDFSDDWLGTRIIEAKNADKTGTHEYTVFRITRNTARECADELDSQITDGYFENVHVGFVEEVTFKR